VSHAVPTTEVSPYFRRSFTVLQVNPLPYYSRVIKAWMNCRTCIWLLFCTAGSLLFLAFFWSQFIPLLVSPF